MKEMMMVEDWEWDSHHVKKGGKKDTEHTKDRMRTKDKVIEKKRMTCLDDLILQRSSKEVFYEQFHPYNSSLSG